MAAISATLSGKGCLGPPFHGNCVTSGGSEVTQVAPGFAGVKLLQDASDRGGPIENVSCWVHGLATNTPCRRTNGPAGSAM